MTSTPIPPPLTPEQRESLNRVPVAMLVSPVLRDALTAALARLDALELLQERLERIPRLCVFAREHHSFDSMYATVEVEPHDEGDLVRYADVAALLTAPEETQ